MKIQYVLSVILVLGAIVASTQTIATDLTYDPYEIYYSKYYGIGTFPFVAETTEQEDTDFYDSYTDYYNAYYGLDTLTTASAASLSGDLLISGIGKNYGSILLKYISKPLFPLSFLYF